jgi:P-type E1-E2 ATPase
LFFTGWSNSLILFYFLTPPTTARCAIADTVRPAAAQAIVHLKRLGIEQIVMLTGDNDRTADSIGWEIGIDQVYAELLPEDKLEVIRPTLTQQ